MPSPIGPVSSPPRPCRHRPAPLRATLRKASPIPVYRPGPNAAWPDYAAPRRSVANLCAAWRRPALSRTVPGQRPFRLQRASQVDAYLTYKGRLIESEGNVETLLLQSQRRVKPGLVVVNLA